MKKNMAKHRENRMGPAVFNIRLEIVIFLVFERSVQYRPGYNNRKFGFVKLMAPKKACVIKFPLLFCRIEPLFFCHLEKRHCLF